MSDVNVWLAMSQQALDQYRAKRTQGDEYSGPMDDLTYKILDKMSDTDVVQGMFKKPTIGGKTYHLFSLYLSGSARVAQALDYITEKWPGHIIALGVWWMDGRQAGTEFTYSDPDPETGEVVVTGVTGTPVYPIPAAAWRIMPDTVTYDAEGVELNRTPATSNADLRDINLLSGQAPRQFTT